MLNKINILIPSVLVFFLLQIANAQQERSKSAINGNALPAHILGNWLNPKNNLWHYGFYNKFAVVDGKFWQYEKIVSKKNRTAILLKNGDGSKKIYLYKGDDENLQIGASEKSLNLYTQKINTQPDFENYDTTDFQPTINAQGKFHLSGLIHGYDPVKDNFRFISIIYNPLLEEEQKNFIAEVDSLGRFDLEFPLINPQEIMLRFGDFIFGFYAIPGSSLVTCINKSSFPRSREVRFMGPIATLNTEWSYYQPRLNKILRFSENDEYTKNSDQLQYKEYRLGKMNEQLTKLSEYSRQYHNSKKIVQQLQNYIKYSAADDLMRYRWMHQITNPERVKLTREYMSFLDEIPLNNEKGILTDTYTSFLQEFTRFLRSEIPVKTTFQEIFDYTKAKGHVIDQEDEKILIRYLESQKKSYSSAEEKRKDSVEFSTVLKKYSGVFKSNEYNLSSQRRMEQSVQSMIKILDSLQSGIGRDIILAIMADDKIASKEILTETDLAFYREKIQHTEIYQAIEESNKDLQTLLSGNMASGINIVSPLKDQQDQVFESLIGKYKGKVVYVDFWAPWCGPCMGEMPNAKELKKELTGKDVVFLYLGVNCTEESWSRTIKAQAMEGEHYLLNKNEYALISNMFRINGIPRYLLINKEGRVVDDDAERPSSKLEVMTAIDRLLK